MFTYDWANQIHPKGKTPSEIDGLGYRRGDGLLGLRRRFNCSVFFYPHADSFT